MRPLLYRFDAAVISSIQAWPQWLYGPMIVITNVGQPITMIIIALIISVVAFSQNNMRLFLASAAVPGTIGITALLKLALRRARPETEYVQNMLVNTFSFPSGHAAGAIVGCGFFAYLTWQALPQPWGGIVAFLLLAMIILIGLSRIYLGAHYPSDVVGGWIVGACGLAVIFYIIKPVLSV